VALVLELSACGFSAAARLHGEPMLQRLHAGLLIDAQVAERAGEMCRHPPRPKEPADRTL
jgi:hypothetical protein